MGEKYLPQDDTFTADNAEALLADLADSLPVETPRSRRIGDRLKATEDLLAKSVEQLTGGIREGHWSSVLQEGTTSEIPALVIGNLIKCYAADHDQPPPAEFSVASKRDITTEDRAKRYDNIREYIRNIKDKLGGRTLVVTEYMEVGETVELLALALHAEGVAFDIVSIETASYTYPHLATMIEDHPEVFEGVRIIVGDSDVSPRLGPTFDRTLLKSAVSTRSEGVAAVPLSTPRDPATTASAEEAVATLTQNLYDQFLR